MKVTYRVVSKVTGNDLTNKASWVLQPNGRLAYNLYGDLIGDPDVDVVFNIEESNQKTGTWKLNRDGSGTCSECGFTQIAAWDYDNHQRYCGCCGAKMKGSVE